MINNKKLIIVISVFVLIAVISSIIAYLFIMTDIFKSNKELFAKYFMQNTEVLEKMTDLQFVKKYEDLKNENQYESNTNIKFLHSEGGEVSNPLNNLGIKLDVQKNIDNQYLYLDGKILYEDEEYLETEIIKEQDLYGIRMPEVVKQFVSVKKDENLQIVADSIGIEINQLEKVIEVIDGNETIIDKNELNLFEERYSNIITTAILNGTFEKQKKAIITYNNEATETNAYSVTLSSEQVKNLLIEILNNIKDETEILNKLPISLDINQMIDNLNENKEIPTIKIIVYEKNKTTIRTTIEIDTYKIIIENIENSEETKSNIKFDTGEEIVGDIEAIKKNAETQESFEIVMDVGQGDENYTISILNQMESLKDEITFNTEIKHKQNITTRSMTIENKVNIGKQFEEIQTLGTNNNVILNNLEEKRIKLIIDLLKRETPKITNQKIEELKQKIVLINEDENLVENIENREQTTQIEINKFNSKFEFYTGDEVSSDNVKKLLDIVKNNFNGYADQDITIGEKTISRMLLYIEKDKTNEESMTKILEKIDDDKKYKVEIAYKESNSLIDYITITEL